MVGASRSTYEIYLFNEMYLFNKRKADPPSRNGK